MTTNPARIFDRLYRRWRMPNGYAVALRLGIPLVISMGTATLMLFTDRIFLSRYSMDAVAAAGPAGALAFVFLALFAGTGNYTNTFIAQYYGASRHRHIGRALWQALYFTLFSGLALACGAVAGRPLFALIGHAPAIRELEICYFQILMIGGLPHVLRDVLACFYSGRGNARPIMVVGIIGTALNIPLDYAMINGWHFIPEMGVAGAAWATVISHLSAALIYIFIIFTPKNNRRHGVISEWRFNPTLFTRLIRFGIPNGLQIAAETMAFTFFLVITGRLGRLELAVSNIVFSINSLVFMPMVGLSIATATLVGQAIGRGIPEGGVQATRSTLHLTSIYMTTMALILVLFPRQLLRLFIASDTPADEIAYITSTGAVLLRFVAAYSLPDVMNVIYSGALRGAGDIRFVTWSMIALSSSTMVLPTFIAVECIGMGIYTVWTIGAVHVCILAFVFRRRFAQGRWKSMRVIESEFD